MDDPRPLRRDGLGSRTAPFALAMLLAFATVALPSSERDHTAIAAAAVLAGAIALAVPFVPWERLPRAADIAPPLGFMAVIALLRHGEGGSVAGYGPLAILPIIWLSLYGGRRELAVAILGTGTVFLAPILLFGAPAYPPEEWRRALLWVAVAAIVGPTVQRLVADARRRADESARRAERLRASEAQTRLIIETAHEAFVTVAADGRIVDWNPRAEAIFGWARREALGRAWADTVAPPDARDAHERAFARSAATGEDADFGEPMETLARHRDGRSFPVEMSVASADVDGERRFFVFLRDITERKRGEETRLLFASIVDSSEEAIIGQALDGTITSWNPAAERVYGWTAEEAIGRHSSILMPEGAREDPAILARVGRGERVHNHLTQRSRKDGGRIEVSLTVSPIEDADGRIVGASTIARDVTEQRRAERYIGGQNAVTSVLAQSGTLDEAIPRLLQALGENLDWQAGVFWTVDRYANELECRTIWLSESVAGADELEELVRPARFPAGHGIAGRVWSTGRVEWTEDLTGAENAVTDQATEAAGIRASVAVPVETDDEVVGVIELFALERRAPEPELIDLLSSFSAQIGLFLERRRAEERAIAHAENIAAVAATREVTRNSDTEGARRAICEVGTKTAGACAAVLYEPDHDGRMLVPRSAAGVELPQDPSDAAIPFVGPPAAGVRAFTSAQPVFVADLAKRPEPGPTLLPPGTVSALWQPVVRDGFAVAVLAVGWDRRITRFSERLASVMSLLAEEASVAMERADLVAKLESYARTDDLTGLPNRRAWEGDLARELARARRDRRPVCVAMLDLDRFKRFNDERGHQAGDRLLKQAAACWRDELRATDVLVRYGGEEFAVILPASGLEDSVTVLERLRAATPAGQTVSAGVAAWNGHETPDELVGRADEALYAAKAGGRDRLVAAEAPALT